MKKVQLKVEGMTCSACSSGLEKYLLKQDGIYSASVNLILGITPSNLKVLVSLDK